MRTLCQQEVLLRPSLLQGDRERRGGASERTKHEQRDGRPERHQQRRLQNLLLGLQPVLQHVRDDDEVVHGEVHRDGDAHAHDDGDEVDALLAQVEAVEGPVHQREGLEEGVVDAVHERHVHVDEHDRRVQEHDLEGLDDGVEEDGARRHAAPLDLRGGADVGLAGAPAQAPRSLQQDRVRRRLGQEEEPEDEDRAGHPEDLPERPAPSATVVRAGAPMGSALHLRFCYH